MPIDFDSEGFDQYIEGQLDKYKFEVGVFSDKQRFKAISPAEFREYDGRTVKKLSRHKSSLKQSQLAKELDERFKWLREPFLTSRNKDVIDVIDLIIDELNGKIKSQRVLNAIQAVIRNPIYRGDYGWNKHTDTELDIAKPALIATSQFFRNILARWIN